MIKGIHHFAIILSSEQALCFYKKLGFEEVLRKERSYDTVVLLKGFDIELECFIDNNHEPRNNPEPLGLRHIAFSVDDIERTIADLKIKIDSINQDWLGRNYCFINDVDGNIIELHE